MRKEFKHTRLQLERHVMLPVFAATMLIISACDTSDRVILESENQDTRIRVIVIHHTTADFQESLEILTKTSDRPVSSHYLIPEPGDPSYQQESLKLHYLVPEDRRAWHAGSSYWSGKTALNDISIGIELVNRAYCHQQQADKGNQLPLKPADREPPRICFYPDFADTQLNILTGLLADISERHTEVKPTHIVGHSDIAPQRKTDPGPRFPWQRLYQLGYGAWYEDATVIRYWQQFSREMPATLTLQDALQSYGYNIELSGDHDIQSQNVVRAFQMHFLPWQVTGELTVDTAAILFALLEKYYSPQISRLLPENL